mmetsp:Transcript_12254/g.13786  ORF Transcript_12254/g.13786 Transcript_12254/m.13786 type:complete len:162 (-) Transcript_12254:37-522(-)
MEIQKETKKKRKALKPPLYSGSSVYSKIVKRGLSPKGWKQNRLKHQHRKLEKSMENSHKISKKVPDSVDSLNSIRVQDIKEPVYKNKKGSHNLKIYNRKSSSFKEKKNEINSAGLRTRTSKGLYSIRAVKPEVKSTVSIRRRYYNPISSHKSARSPLDPAK